jgi:hypothetical protein
MKNKIYLNELFLKFQKIKPDNFDVSIISFANFLGILLFENLFQHQSFYRLI